MNSADGVSPQDSEDKGYVIIKIPRDSLRSNGDSAFISALLEGGVRKKIWIALCVLSLFVGAVLGSFLHPSLVHHTPDKAVWKSANLMPTDSK